MTRTSDPPACCTGLTPSQVRVLLTELPHSRLSSDDRGNTALEHWDVRRTLIRVFGFAGFDIDDDDPVLIKEVHVPPDNPQGKHRWTVAYRAKTHLTVKCVHGRPIAHWDGTAAEGAYKQPDLAAAHDLAMKSAASQALKRAAINLGDQFGLSLYNGGNPKAVVLDSAAYWKAEQPLPHDAPVQPEPGTREAAEAARQQQPTAAEAPRDDPWVMPNPQTDYRAWVDYVGERIANAPTRAALEVLRRAVVAAKPFLQPTDRDVLFIADQKRVEELKKLEARAA